MNKKIITITLLASVLTLNLSYTAFAASASTNTVVTGRTEQNNQSGKIIPAEIQTQIYHNVTKEIDLTGTIIIDGPQLVFTVTDPKGNNIASDKISVVKIDDKTYSYSVKVDPSNFKDNVDYTLNAKTVYKNGQPAGQTHTSAPEQKQTIHVAYVSGFKYNDFTWGTYDQDKKEYSYSYELVKIWDDGTEKSETITGTVSCGDSVEIEGKDETYDGEPVELGTEVAPNAPEQVTPIVSNVSISGITSNWTGNEANGGNVQEEYTLNYSINGNTYSVKQSTNFTKNGTEFVDQKLVYKATFNDQTVNVNYILPYVAPASTADNTSNNTNGNGNSQNN